LVKGRWASRGAVWCLAVLRLAFWLRCCGGVGHALAVCGPLATPFCFRRKVGCRQQRAFGRSVWYHGERVPFGLDGRRRATLVWTLSSSPCNGRLCLLLTATDARRLRACGFGASALGLKRQALAADVLVGLQQVAQQVREGAG
jgi:hypothetical protein